MLAHPVVFNQVKDTKAARESRALEEFQKMLANDSSRAFYGPVQVMAAAEMGAIDTLLICDSLFKSIDGGTRKKYVKFVEDVRGCGSNVYILSAAHVSGEQLNLLTGIAAILRYPLPELEDLENPGD